MIRQKQNIHIHMFLDFFKTRIEDFNQSSLHEKNQTMPLTHKTLDCSGSLRLKVCLASVFSLSMYSFLISYVFFHFFFLRYKYILIHFQQQFLIKN